MNRSYFLVALLAVFSILICFAECGVTVRADVDELSGQQKARAYSVMNSRIKITKASTKGRSVTIKWSTLSVSGVKYETAIKKYESKSYRYNKTSADKRRFGGLKRGALYALSVRPYVVIEGEQYSGKWSAVKLKRVKIKSSYAAIKEAYRRYRFANGLTDGCYSYKDIDNNGVPEMLFRSRKKMGIYTADKTTAAVKKLREMKSGKGTGVPLYYSTKNHQVYMSSYSSSGSCGWLCRVDGKKIYRLKRFEYNNGKYEPKTYQINGINVSAGVYNSAKESVTKSFTRLIYIH